MFGILHRQKVAYIKLDNSKIGVFYLYLSMETHTIMLCCLSRVSELTNEIEKESVLKIIRKTFVIRVHTYLLTYLLPTTLPTYIHTYIHTHTYMHAYIHTYNIHAYMITPASHFCTESSNAALQRSKFGFNWFQVSCYVHVP